MMTMLFKNIRSRSGMLLGALGVASLLGFSGCTTECVSTYLDLQPQYAKLSELRQQPMGIVASREIENPGKIYLYNNTLLINEVGEGIHIFDNFQPDNPIPIGFLEIPGNVDMAVRNGILYADSYIDLVAFNVSNWSNPVQLGRLENLYTSNSYPLGEGLMGWYNESTDEVITGYNATLVENTNCNTGNFVTIDWGGNPVMMEGDMLNAIASPTSAGGQGQGGSMARFSLAGAHLYAVDSWQLQVVGLSDPANPNRVNIVDLSWGVETIFSYQNLLLFGTTTGLIIHSLEDPENPGYLSRIDHAQACDPVVVQNDLAYYTIRSGNQCGQAEDLLGVVDISDPANPVEIATHAMDNPYGLGIDGDALFICEGDKGLKIFDASDYSTIGDEMMKRYQNVHAWDVIPTGTVLLMIGADGLYQYDYSDLNDIRQISHIPAQYE